MTPAAVADTAVRIPSPAPPVAPLRVTCWGTRGSLPVPGPETVRFGGNTSCVEVRDAEGHRLVFDAGTGIRALSRRMAAEPGPAEADVFVSHFHWDHIQGFPFFTQLYDGAARIRVHGPGRDAAEVEGAFAGQMGSVYFPVPMEALGAELRFAHVDGTPWRRGDVEVVATRVRHGTCTFGYRVRAGGASVAYVPDNELGAAGDDGWYDGLVEFLRGVDVLLHDAMYTDEEYARFAGWGHSTMRQAVRLAEDAGVRRLLLFHHAPDRGDAELDRLVAALRAEVAGRGSALEVAAAAEGEEIAVHAAPGDPS